VIRTSLLNRLGEIQHTALGDTTTKRRTGPDHRVTTHDVKSHLHLHRTWLLEEKRKKNFIIITTFLRTIPIMNILFYPLSTTTVRKTLPQMKSVQEETQKTVSDFASRTLTHQEIS